MIGYILRWDLWNLLFGNFIWTFFKKGRDPDETSQMMQRICSYNQNLSNKSDKIRISLELEKMRFELGGLIQFVDVVFLGKDLARHWGSVNKIDAVERFADKFPDW